MQAITTKYLCPTNFHGARIKAKCERGSITLSWPDELNSEAAHLWAKGQLIARFVKEDAERYGTKENPWTRPTACGQLYSGEYVHVFTGEKTAELYSALKRALPWLGKLVAEGVHNNTVCPNDAIGAMQQAQAAIDLCKAEATQ